MTIQKAIEEFDFNRANTVSLKHKIEWLSQLEYKIFSLLKVRKTDVGFEGYTELTPLNTELLAPESYGEIYVSYLVMMLDFKNGEIGRYNNSAMMFNRLFGEMSNYINRETSVKKKTKIKAGDIYV